MNRKILISVIGGHDISPKIEKLAYSVGQIIARNKAVLVCGGLTGSMEMAAKGAKAAGGSTIGLIPGKDKNDANPYIDIVIATTIGYARNAMVACSGDIIVALPGSHGTLSEICYGFVYNRPIVNMGGWKRPGMIQVKGLKGLDTKLKALIKDVHSKGHKE